MSAVWIADPAETDLDEAEVHRRAGELADRTRQVAAETWPEIYGSLTERGQTMFVMDILEALKIAEDDPEPVARVAEAWWRTMQARASYSKNLKDFGQGRVYGSADLQKALRL